jgi:septal ring factor EnvC (AmiA/AmiB activator)
MVPQSVRSISRQNTYGVRPHTGGFGTARSTARQTEREAATARKLALVQSMLANEQRMRKSAEKILVKERNETARLKAQLGQSARGTSRGTARSTARGTGRGMDPNVKLRAYQDIMSSLVQALDRSGSSPNLGRGK